MSDNNSAEFEILLRTKAELVGSTATVEAMQQVGQSVAMVKGGTEELVVAQGKGAAAAEGMSASNLNLRQTFRGVHSAGSAVSSLVQGDFVHAFQSGARAATSLGTAMRGAFVPTAIIAGITLAVQGITWLFAHSREQAEQLKKETEETAKAMEAAATAEAARIKALADAEIRSLGEARAEAEALVKIIDQLAGSADKARERVDKMTDAKADMAAALVDQREMEALAAAKDDVERAEIRRDANRQRNSIRHGADAEKAVREQQAAKQALEVTTGSSAEAQKQLRGSRTEEGAAEYEAQAKAAAAEAATQRRQYIEDLKRQQDEALSTGDPQRTRKIAEELGILPDAETAKGEEEAAKAAMVAAQEKFKNIANRTVTLAQAVADLDAKVKEAAERAQIATLKTDTQAIKSGLDAGKIDQTDSAAVLAARQKQNEEAAKNAERDRAANLAANEQEQEAVQNKIAAVELRIKSGEKDQVQLQKDLARIDELKKQLLDLGLAKEALENAVSRKPSQAQADAHALASVLIDTLRAEGATAGGHGRGASLITGGGARLGGGSWTGDPSVSGAGIPSGNGSHAAHGLSTGHLTTGHVQGAGYVPTDFEASQQFRIDTRPGQIDTSPGKIDLRTSRQRAADAARGQSDADLNRDDVGSAIADAHAALGKGKEGGDIRGLIEVNKLLLDAFKGSQGEETRRAIEKLKRDVDILSSQLRNGRS